MSSQILHGLSYDEYDALPGLRAGELKEFRRSPAHYRAKKNKPDDDKESRQFGSIFHSAMENREKFWDMAAIEPEFVGFTKDGRESSQSKEAKERKLIWREENKAKIIVPNKWAVELTGMISAVSQHKLVSKVIRDGIREASIVVTDPSTGVKLKCRPDLIATSPTSKIVYIVDYKTTRDASPGFFSNQIFSDRGYSPFYALTSAHYAHVGKIAGIGDGGYFVIIAIEKDPPFGIQVYELKRHHLSVGEDGKMGRAALTRMYAKCTEKNEWPCYGERAIDLTIPNYCEYGTEWE